MRRKQLGAATVLAVGIVVTALVTTGTATASASASDTADKCQPDDLQVSVAPLPDDPVHSPGKFSWNLAFKNISDGTCTVTGWPTLDFVGLAPQVEQVAATNVGLADARPVELGPNEQAIVVIQTHSTENVCRTVKSLQVATSSDVAPTQVDVPALNVDEPCVADTIMESPYVARDTIRNQIHGLSVTDVPPAFPEVAGPAPNICMPDELEAREVSASTTAHTQVRTIAVTTNGQPCLMPGLWPAVQIHLPNGDSAMAKVVSSSPLASKARDVVRIYDGSSPGRAGVLVSVGRPAVVEVISPTSGPAAVTECASSTSASIYPAYSADGPAVPVQLESPIEVCGIPRVLPYMPAGDASVDDLVSNAAESLAPYGPFLQATTQSSDGTVSAMGDSAGFWYGTDSSGPTACGTGPYKEPAPTCSSGTNGRYGFYGGMVGDWHVWKGCAYGLAWNQTNGTMANKNYATYGVGLGAAPYWLAAGPGRDPSYNGTTSQANTWGTNQAKYFVNTAIPSHLNGIFQFGYAFFDIETEGTPDGNGWNAVWTGPCGSYVNTGIAYDVDHATYNGWWTYVNQNSSYWPAVYSAGGSSSGSWLGIMGSGNDISHTSEWTFTNESSVIDFPSGWSNSYASAQWFGNAPAACYLVWQWSGGDGKANGYGDYDQVSTDNRFACD